jgi:hypothetical protein
MDWERVKFFAVAIVSGRSKADLAKQGYFMDATDEDAWTLASSQPQRYADEEVESDIGVSAALPPEILEQLV